MSLRPISEVAVIGAGWAGLAAAIELLRAGHHVTLFEAAATAGGRARALGLTLAGAEVELDNGQHLLIGAYRECERLSRLVSGTAGPALQRHRLLLRSVDGLHLQAANLPAPWHLLAALRNARGLHWRERFAILRFLVALRMRGWRTQPDETVQALLTRLHQPASLQRRLWAPLALGALNTTIEQACAQAFATVLEDSLGAQAQACDFLLPTASLSDVLPRPALRWLEHHGARIRMRCAVQTLTREAAGWRLRTPSGEHDADQVVLAVPAPIAAGLLAPVAHSDRERATVDALSRFQFESIASVYLAWPEAEVPALPAWIMLEERPDCAGFGQWLFDRGVQQGLRLAAVVISARGRVSDLDSAALAQGAAEQVAAQLALPKPADWRAIVDKRATFLCLPNRPRPDPGAFGSLRLAGDHLWPDYPATLEGAVRSGIAAAAALAR